MRLHEIMPPKDNREELLKWADAHADSIKEILRELKRRRNSRLRGFFYFWALGSLPGLALIAGLYFDMPWFAWALLIGLVAYTLFRMRKWRDKERQ